MQSRLQVEPAGLTINYFLKAKPKSEVKVQIFKGSMLINEMKGGGDPGLNSVLWNMNARRERTEAEKKAMQGQRQRFGGADMADIPPEYAAQFRSQMDPNYISFAAQEGDYKVVLTVGKGALTTTATILPDIYSQK